MKARGPFDPKRYANWRASIPFTNAQIASALRSVKVRTRLNPTMRALELGRVLCARPPGCLCGATHVANLAVVMRRGRRRLAARRLEKIGRSPHSPVEKLLKACGKPVENLWISRDFFLARHLSLVRTSTYNRVPSTYKALAHTARSAVTFALDARLTARPRAVGRSTPASEPHRSDRPSNDARRGITMPKRHTQPMLIGAEFDRGAGSTREDDPIPVEFEFDSEALAARRTQLDHLAYHGPGLTFGELEIGAPFTWAYPIPPGPEPLYKRTDTRYSWPGGFGTAERYYRVERWSK